MYDPVMRAQGLEKLVADGNRRGYYRFRPAKWYSGIVTGDVTGCNLLCQFCWAGDNIRVDPGGVGKMYTPERSFKRLDKIGRSKGFSQVRLSGQEPTIGRKHLLELLAMFDRTDYTFILETNGIMIGHDRSYAKALAEFENLQVRVSLKGCDEEEFSKLTGAVPEGFGLQLKGLENLWAKEVEVWPAVMMSFSSKETVGRLIQRLVAIGKDLARQLEIEELILYPHVTRRLKREGIGHGKAHDPAKVPKRLV
jgi:uncharacterized Fe-S cluster-containing radical SAM superfamily protein